MKKAIVLVENCGECPRSTLFTGLLRCRELEWKRINPDTIDPECPLDDAEVKQQ